MFKLSLLFSSLTFFGCSYFSDFTLPRLTGSAADFFLMPFCGYLVILLSAQLALRLSLVKATRQ